MIDFHNHILPNIDDGSKSLEMTINMLREAEKQGITDIVNTTHYKHPKMSNKKINYRNIKVEIEKLQTIIKEKSISIKLHFGTEILFHNDLIKLKNDNLATFHNGKYMLIEFLTNFLPENQRNVLFELKMKGVTPIIAHPERYLKVQKNIEIVSDWLEAGCIIQIDAGSLLGKLGKEAKVTSQNILNNRWCQIIGSDAHNDTNRNFCLLKAFEYARESIGSEAIKLVLDNPMSVISGDDIQVNINYDKLNQKTIFSSIKKKLFNS